MAEFRKESPEDKKTRSGQNSFPGSFQSYQRTFKPSNKKTNVNESNNTSNNKNYGNGQNSRSKLNHQSANNRGTKSQNDKKFTVQKFVYKNESKQHVQDAYRGRNRSGQYKSFHPTSNVCNKSSNMQNGCNSPGKSQFKIPSLLDFTLKPTDKIFAGPESSSHNACLFESPPRLFNQNETKFTNFSSNQDGHRRGRWDRHVNLSGSKVDISNSENYTRLDKYSQSEQRKTSEPGGVVLPAGIMNSSSFDGSYEGDDDVRSDNYSQSLSVCDSLRSLDRDPEINILNQIHILKTTLHSLDNKPSIHVFNEIKGFKDYIDLIIDKWNPKKRENDSLGSDAESVSTFQQTKKKKENIVKQNAKSKDNDDAVFGSNIEVMCDTSVAECSKTDQQENRKECFNSNTIPGNSQKSSSSQRDVSESSSRSSSKSRKRKNRKNKHDAPNDSNFRRVEVGDIIKKIRLNSVMMNKDDQRVMKTELKKIDSTHFGLDKLDDNLRCITLCMVKLIENKTIAYELVEKILQLLKKYLVEASGEENLSMVENLMGVYKETVDALKNKNEEFTVRENKPESIRDLKANKNFFNIFLNFHDQVLTDMNATLSDDDTDEEFFSDGADELNSGDETESSSKEDKEESQKVELSKEYPKIKLSNNLSLHCLSFIESGDSILNQVNNLLKKFELTQTAVFKNEERKVILHIRESLKQLYPNHVLYIFGSRGSNMALPDSDFDIYVDVTGCGYFKGTDYETQQMYVQKIKKQFFRKPSLFSTILGLVKTRVPIIKIHHKPTLLNCDISFKSGISVENTLLLRYYLNIDRNVKWLISAVKLWAQYNDLYGSSFFTSHALNWLVLFYLMQVAVVPPVIDLKYCSSKVIHGWDVSFGTLNSWTPARLHALSLFKGFFRFLTSTDFKSSFLCTLTGEVISKASFENLDFVRQYKNGIFNDWVKRIEINQIENLTERQDPTSALLSMEENALCIQDPFEYSKNVSNPVKLIKFKHFLQQSRLTHNRLTSAIPSH